MPWWLCDCCSSCLVSTSSPLPLPSDDASDENEEELRRELRTRQRVALQQARTEAALRKERARMFAHRQGAASAARQLEVSLLDTAGADARGSVAQQHAAAAGLYALERFPAAVAASSPSRLAADRLAADAVAVRRAATFPQEHARQFAEASYLSSSSSSSSTSPPLLDAASAAAAATAATTAAAAAFAAAAAAPAATALASSAVQLRVAPP